MPQWKPTSRFPSSDLDLAFVVPDSVAAEKVDKAHPPERRARCSSTWHCSTSTAGTGIAEGTRSLAYRLRLQAADRTLTDDDVAQVRDKVDRRRRQAGRTVCAAEPCTDAQFALRSSGALATHASRPPWRRSTVAPQVVGSGCRTRRRARRGAPSTRLRPVRRRAAAVPSRSSRGTPAVRTTVGDRVQGRAPGRPSRGRRPRAPRPVDGPVEPGQRDQRVELHRTTLEQHGRWAHAVLPASSYVRE